MSKTKLAAIIGVITVLLTTGAIVYAQDDSTNSTDTQDKQTMMKSAVEEGVISQEQADSLKGYAQGFRTEKRKEMMEERLQTAIDDGTITEDEAQQIRDWFDSRPDVLEKLASQKGKTGMRGMGMGGHDIIE